MGRGLAAKGALQHRQRPAAQHRQPLKIRSACQSGGPHR